MVRKPNPYLIDDDAPELSDEELASARPAFQILSSEVFASLVAAEPKRRPGQRGQGKKPAKEPVTLRLDPEVVAHFRATGPGWQRRISDVVRDAASGRFRDTAATGTGKPMSKTARSLKAS